MIIRSRKSKDKHTMAKKRQKDKTLHRKLKIEQHEPIKYREWTPVLRKGKQFLLNIRHLSCLNVIWIGWSLHSIYLIYDRLLVCTAVNLWCNFCPVYGMYLTFIHAEPHGWCQPHVEQVQLYLPEHLSSTPVFNTVRVAHLYFSVFFGIFLIFFLFGRVFLSWLLITILEHILVSSCFIGKARGMVWIVVLAECWTWLLNISIIIHVQTE